MVLGVLFVLSRLLTNPLFLSYQNLMAIISLNKTALGAPGG